MWQNCLLKLNSRMGNVILVIRNSGNSTILFGSFDVSSVFTNPAAVSYFIFCICISHQLLFVLHPRTFPNREEFLFAHGLGPGL